jgi:hypothetical protein
LSRLETEAFSESGLQSIHLSASLEVIGETCFGLCSSLESITIDPLSKLQRIEDHAFAFTALTELRIPGCISSFSALALISVNLETFVISGISTTYRIFGFLLQKLSGNLLIRYSGGDENVVIDSSVEMICEMCFFRCSSPSFVTFEANSRLSRLEKQTVSDSGLRSIHIPKSVEVICNFCFSCCSSLESVTFEADSRLSRLEDNAFSATELRSILLPRSIEVIGESCFASCFSFASVTFETDSFFRCGIAHIIFFDLIDHSIGWT